MNARSFPRGLKIAAALVLVMGLFMLGVALTPTPVPAQALSAQPAGSNPKPLFVPTPIGGNKNGTLASFTALIPQMLVVNLPLIVK